MATLTARWLVSLLLVSVSFSTRLAAAQGAEEQRSAAARALFQEGNALLEAEDWAQAADRFERALELRDSPQIAYNLTTALVELGHLVRATEVLQALERAEDTPARVIEASAARRAEIAPRIGRLTIRAEGNRQDVVLEMDGRELAWAMVGVQLPADPGPHELRARQGDRTLDEASVVVPEGGATEATLNLSPTVPTPEEVARGVEPEEPIAAPIERPKRRWWIGVIVGVVVAGAAVGLALGLRGDSQAAFVPGTTGHVIFGGDS